jgi:predicted transcriptional regulator
MATTGRDLRNERRLADITTVEQAKRMGVSRATLYTLEQSAEITVERAAQYRAALADAIVAAREKVA